jgi:dephospho-CoA kinase
MNNHQSIIGITGGIGAGKSLVSRYLRLNNIPVYDCDYSAKILMNTDESFKRDLIAKLGAGIINKNREIDKKILADKIFNNSKNLQIINELVRVLITKDIQKWIGEFHTKPIIAIESAILYSSGLYRLCNQIWIVSASKTTRIARVKQRSNLSEQQIIQRITVQEKEYNSLPRELTKDINNDVNCNIIKQLTSLLTE